MSHRKPSKTKFDDKWRKKAICAPAVQADPELKTAWDNIFVDWGEDYVPDRQAEIARQLCFACPVREMCLIDALSDNQAEGIRAGFRFSQGTVSKEDARAILKEFSLRAKVKKTRYIVETDETEEVQEVWEDD